MNNSYSIVLILFILVIHPASAISEKNVAIESAVQFQHWCKNLSYQHFRKKKQRAYNWSASTIRQLNDYQTSGNWKVNNVEMKVHCQIRIGKKAKKTKLEIY